MEGRVHSAVERSKLYRRTGRLKKLTSVPVCVGFGISIAEHAATIARAGADGVIIGSKIVELIEDNLGKIEKMLVEVSTFLREVKGAIVGLWPTEQLSI